MALTDPQVITVNSVAKSMPRINIEGRKTTYKNADGTFTLAVSHQGSNRRVRSMARVDQLAIVADPLTAASDYETLTIYVVIDRPEYGFSVTQVDQLTQAFKAWLDTTMVSKLYGQES